MIVKTYLTEAIMKKQHRKTPFAKLLQSFADLFPRKHKKFDYRRVIDIAKDEEARANIALFDYAAITYPHVLDDMGKRGYTLTEVSIIKYLYGYCMLQNRCVAED